MQVGEVAQQDLGLRADARADLEEPPAPAERQPVVDQGLEEARLAVEPLALLLAVAVEIAGLTHNESLAQLRMSLP